MDLMDVRRSILLAQDQFLPPEYQKVDYLQCNGYNARIDTGIFGDDNTLSFDFTYMALSQVNYAGNFGNYINEQTRNWRFIQNTTSYPRMMTFNGNMRRAGASTGITVVSDTSIVGHKIHVFLSYGHIETESDDGFTTAVDQTSDGTTDGGTKNIAIGAPSPTNTGGTVRARFYDSFKIMKSDILIRNYIPCYRKSDNKAGFYDTVNHTFNPSIGTAEFIAGNDAA